MENAIQKTCGCDNCGNGEFNVYKYEDGSFDYIECTLCGENIDWETSPVVESKVSTAELEDMLTDAEWSLKDTEQDKEAKLNNLRDIVQFILIERRTDRLLEQDLIDRESIDEEPSEPMSREMALDMAREEIRGK